MAGDAIEAVIAEVGEVFARHVSAFLTWAAANWSIDQSSRQDEVFADKSDDYVAGYNAALEGLAGAYECWAEEHPF